MPGAGPEIANAPSQTPGFTHQDRSVGLSGKVLSGSVVRPACSWIGTCFNPSDGKSYLVAYRDCCGQDACAQSVCLGTDGDEPAYRPQSNNDIIWCYGASSLMYNCSTAAIVGMAG